MNWEPLCRVMPQYEGSAMAPDLLKYKDTYYIYYPAAEMCIRDRDVNVVRRRANAKKMFTTVTIGDIADERARELYLEEWRQPELVSTDSTSSIPNRQCPNSCARVNISRL